MMYELVLYGFNHAHHGARKFKEGIVHNMCNEEEFGFVDFRLNLD